MSRLLHSMETGSTHGNRRVTFVLVCVGFAIDKADAALLPAVYRELCAAFGVGPQFLGTVTLARGLAQSAVAICAGPLSRRYDRTRVIGFGIIGWGVATGLVGMAWSPTTLLIARALNGIGLGLVIPVTYALVSDLFPPATRGRAFGMLQFSGNAGGLLGAVFATSLAGHDVYGVSGWRLSFYVAGIASVLLGCVVLIAAADVADRTFASASTAGRDLMAVVRIRSLQVIIVQGMFGSMPWFAFGFLVLWLEVLGFSNSSAARLRLLFDLGSCGGVIAAGFFIDRTARSYAKHGLPGLAQFSVGSGIPFFLLIFYLLPALHPGPWA